MLGRATTRALRERRARRPGRCLGRPAVATRLRDPLGRRLFRFVTTPVPPVGEEAVPCGEEAAVPGAGFAGAPPGEAGLEETAGAGAVPPAAPRIASRHAAISSAAGRRAGSFTRRDPISGRSGPPFTGTGASWVSRSSSTV